MAASSEVKRELDVSTADYYCARIQWEDIHQVAALSGQHDFLESRDIVKLLGGKTKAEESGYNETVYNALLDEIIKRQGSSFHIPDVFNPTEGIQDIDCRDGDAPNVTHITKVLSLDQNNVDPLPVHTDEKRTFSFPEDNVSFSNDFPGGRLTNVRRLSANSYEFVIQAETQEPINSSPWYSFQAWSAVPTDIQITLTYEGTSTDKAKEGGFDPIFHRYHPKISSDRQNWQPLTDEAIKTSDDKRSATFTLSVGEKPLWVSAQEIMSSEDINTWADGLTENHSFVTKTVIGQSVQGRDIIRLDLSEGDPNKPYLVIVSGQHPPEVTGRMAMMTFVETLCGSSTLANRFRENINIVVIPMVNPDGIDAGFWRYNLNGIDTNRNWAAFNNPETAAVRDNLMPLREYGIAYAIDFHSTQSDVMYFREHTDETDGLTNVAERDWANNLGEALPHYEFKTRITSSAYPAASNWLGLTFDSPAVTYEVGDNTDRKELQKIAKVAAQKLMTQLLEE